MVSILVTSSTGQLQRYVRVIEDGNLVGTCETAMSELSDCLVIDYLCTSDTTIKLRSVPTRTRSSDVNDCVNLWELLVAAERKPGLGFMSFILIAGTQHNHFHGITSEFIQNHAKRISSAPRHLNLSLHQFWKWKVCAEQLYSNVQLQLKILNCLPPQRIQFPKCQAETTWSSQSIKQRVLNGLRDSKLNEYIAECIPNRQPRISNPSNSRYPVGSPNRFALPKTRGSLRNLESQFIESGVMRIVETTISGVTVAWNSYNSYKGDTNLRFAITD